MTEKTLNQVLADNLLELRGIKWDSPEKLAKDAGIAGNTVRNYLKAATGQDHQYISAKGRENSATLTNIQLLADVLGVPAILLMLDKTSRRKLAAEALILEADLVRQGQPKKTSVTGRSLLLGHRRKPKKSPPEDPASPSEQSPPSPDEGRGA